MKVEYLYEAPRRQELPGGTLEWPAQLDIALRWKPEISEARVVCVSPNQDILVTFATGPVQLIGISGAIRDPGSWSVVTQLIGANLWAEVGQPPELITETHAIDIDPSTLEHLIPRWSALLEASISGRLQVIPRQQSAREQELFDLVTNDPDFTKDGISLLRELYGPEPEDPTPIRPPAD